MKHDVPLRVSTPRRGTSPSTGRVIETYPSGRYISYRIVTARVAQP